MRRRELFVVIDIFLLVLSFERIFGPSRLRVVSVRIDRDLWYGRQLTIALPVFKRAVGRIWLPLDDSHTDDFSRSYEAFEDDFFLIRVVRQWSKASRSWISYITSPHQFQISTGYPSLAHDTFCPRTQRKKKEKHSPVVSSTASSSTSSRSSSSSVGLSLWKAVCGLNGYGP